MITFVNNNPLGMGSFTESKQALPNVGLQCVIVVFPDYANLLIELNLCLSVLSG